MKSKVDAEPTTKDERPKTKDKTVSIYDIDVRTIQGATCSLGGYRGQTLLIVNLASHCVFTPQYAGLEALYRRYQARGLAVLGFPCNQFRRQEPGTADEIQAFCAGSYGVTFPLFAKVDVNGARAHPLYRWLKAERAGVLWTEAIKWNFTKFLVNERGEVVRRYGPAYAPERIAPDIDAIASAASPRSPQSR